MFSCYTATKGGMRFAFPPYGSFQNDYITKISRFKITAIIRALSQTKEPLAKIHVNLELFQVALPNIRWAQAFQPVPAQAEACGYILQEALKSS